MSRTILIADDDTALLKLYATMLAGEHTVLVADSGVGAVEMAEAQRIDLVIMDLNMPGLDGWMAMSLIRARRPEVPFLVISSLKDVDLEKRALASGAAAFLPKPVDAETLRRAVTRAMKATTE